MNPEASKKAVVLISYFPLFSPWLEYDYAGREYSVDDLESIINKMDENNSGVVHGCMWVYDENGPQPIMIVDRAKELADHLIQWAEQEPSEWFEIAVNSKDDKYAIVLMPNIQRSINRWKFAHFARHGEDVDYKFNVLFDPIHFVSSQSHTFFSKVKSEFESKDKSDLYFLDAKDVEDDMKKSADKAIKVGTFNVDTDHSQYVSRLIEETLD